MKKMIFKFALLAVLLVLMNWIYAKFFFKTAIQKQLVLLKDNPPLVNRFKLASGFQSFS